MTEGHIDSIVREAIRHGVDPITAVQMATINPAECFGLNHLGAIAPGRQADMVVFSDLSAPVAEEVYCRGVLVAQGGRPAPGIAPPPPVPVAPSLRVRPEVLDFTVRRAGDRIRVIEVVPDQIITRQSVEAAPVRGDVLVSDPARDLLKIAVVERHQASGRMSVGFVRGLGLKRGALASSVAHDSHNIIVTGVADADLRTAVSAVSTKWAERGRRGRRPDPRPPAAAGRRAHVARAGAFGERGDGPVGARGPRPGVDSKPVHDAVVPGPAGHTRTQNYRPWDSGCRPVRDRPAIRLRVGQAHDAAYFMFLNQRAFLCSGGLNGLKRRNKPPSCLSKGNMSP